MSSVDKQTRDAINATLRTKLDDAIGEGAFLHLEDGIPVRDTRDAVLRILVEGLDDSLGYPAEEHGFAAAAVARGAKDEETVQAYCGDIGTENIVLGGIPNLLTPGLWAAVVEERLSEMAIQAHLAAERGDLDGYPSSIRAIAKALMVDWDANGNRHYDFDDEACDEAAPG